MSELWQAFLSYGFMQNAVMVSVLAGISCGVVGTYVVTRRISYSNC